MPYTKNEITILTAKQLQNGMPRTNLTGKMNEGGNYGYELAKMITIYLPNAVGKCGKNSTKNRLFKFFSNPSAAIDTLKKGKWFEFTNVRFVSRVKRLLQPL